MADDEWTTLPVRKSLYEEMKKVAEKRHYPNVTQYGGEVLRKAVEEDQLRLQKLGKVPE